VVRLRPEHEKEDLVQVLNGRLTPAEERRMAESAFEMVRTVLSPQSVACYWERILFAVPWSAPERQSNGVPIVDVLVMDQPDMQFNTLDAAECVP
jgi:hypothetical protein